MSSYLKKKNQIKYAFHIVIKKIWFKNVLYEKLPSSSFYITMHLNTKPLKMKMHFNYTKTNFSWDAIYGKVINTQLY